MRTTGKIRMRMGILAAAALCLALIPGIGTFAGRIRKTRTMRGKIKIQEPRTGMHNRTGTEPALILILMQLRCPAVM